MNLRRAVALLLLIAVAASSVEVLFGLETTLADSEVAVVLDGGQIDAVPDSSRHAEEDCPCLCACLCSGSQLVVAPAAAPIGPTLAVAAPVVAPGASGSRQPSPSPRWAACSPYGSAY